MKAILLIDMPDMCLNCDLYGFQSCYPLQRRIDRDGLKMVDKPEWCPLRPMPKRYAEDDFVIETPRDAEACAHGVQVGRNIVINEILGETE